MFALTEFGIGGFAPGGESTGPFAPHQFAAMLIRKRWENAAYCLWSTRLFLSQRRLTGPRGTFGGPTTRMP